MEIHKVVEVIVEKGYGGSYVKRSLTDREILTKVYIHLTEQDLKAILKEYAKRKFRFLT